MQVARGMRVYSGSITYSSRRGMAKAVCGFNMSGVALAAHSDSSKPKKQGKRLRKQERRLLIEKFVQKYRASNSGRFPGIAHTRKEVGGSYYVLREIIQELKYKCKNLHVNDVVDHELESVDIQYTEGKEQSEDVVELEKGPSYDAEPGVSGKDSDMLEAVANYKVIKSSSHPTPEAGRNDLSLDDKHKVDQAAEVTKTSRLDDELGSIAAGTERCSISCEAHALEDSPANRSVSSEKLSRDPEPESLVQGMGSISVIPNVGEEIYSAPKELHGIDDREHSQDNQENLQKENLQREPPTEKPPLPKKHRTLWASFMNLADGLLNHWRKK